MYRTSLATRRIPSNYDSGQQQRVFADYVASEHSLLELGCGKGEVLCGLECHAKAGVEADANLAAIAADKGIDVRPTIDSFAGTTFDRLLVGEEPRDLTLDDLRQLRTLLSQTGLLLISRPIDDEGRLLRPMEYREHTESLRELLRESQFTVDSISVRRYSYRTSPFQFGNSDSPTKTSERTYWMVKPFLSLVAVARRG